MTISYTTHLICAPQLPEAAEVAVFHVKPGQFVAADTPMMTLLAADQEWPVFAPDSGQVASLMVAHGDFVNTGDLLLLMEIEEKPLGSLGVESIATVAIAAPIAPAAASKAVARFDILPAAAALAAKLGIDLTALPHHDVIDEAAVLEFARLELAKLAKLRQILS